MGLNWTKIDSDMWHWSWHSMILTWQVYILYKIKNKK